MMLRCQCPFAPGDETSTISHLNTILHRLEIWGQRWQLARTAAGQLPPSRRISWLLDNRGRELLYKAQIPLFPRVFLSDMGRAGTPLTLQCWVKFSGGQRESYGMASRGSRVLCSVCSIAGTLQASPPSLRHK
ncbi:hypothetical protein Pcinc_000147 [Petrolisthes cinctipes]|uniref:Uncharacterized protein n=1 Tax=Petrolisthes cinctipes TaxID=88211 RepID=A0AAE1GQ72_PETCI|nr:hypothetical protein Pcinc_000147 [Petrolisthes cinctipes]